MTAVAAARDLDDGERRALARLERASAISAARRAAHVVAAQAAMMASAAGEATPGLSERERQGRTLEAWTAVHRLVHRSAYRDEDGALRSRQWDAARVRFAGLGHGELDAWLALQVEVARNRERGIPDLRPRKNGPTFLVLLEHVANAKRKAKAVLGWAIAADPDAWGP